MKKLPMCILLFYLLGGSAENSVSYKNYKTFDVLEKGTDIPPLWVRSNLKNIDILKEYKIFDEEKIPHTFRSYLVPKFVEKEFVKLCKLFNANCNVSIDDLGEKIEEERVSSQMPLRNAEPNPGLKLDHYYSFEEINEYLKYITTIKHPRKDEPIAEVENIGHTYEGRTMFLVKISSNHSQLKPVILFEAGIHAREWTAPASALYMIHQLVENFSANEKILDDIDFYIIPLSNPDGYEYSRSKDRLWRKTRSKNFDTYGVDGNRNFGFHWGERGASADPDTDTYRGPRPFSEEEVANIRDVGVKYQNRLKAFISIHAFGPLIVYPWSYARTSPAPYNKEMGRIARAAADAIKDYDGTFYLVGVSSVLMYEASGGADDYFKGVLGVELSYTIELSSAGESSFIVPIEKLDAIVSESFEAYKVFAKLCTEFQKQTISFYNFKLNIFP